MRGPLHAPVSRLVYRTHGHVEGEADFSNIMPIHGTPFRSTAKGFTISLSSFSDTALFLPLLGSYRYKKGDGKKVMFSYGLGALFVLFFLAVFYGIFSSVALRQEFAFVKTAQYFQALAVIGHFDLILTYLMTVVLLFYYSFILQSSVLCFSQAIGAEKRVWISAALNAALFLFAILCNRYYKRLFGFITGRLFWIFPIFAYVVPLLCLCLKRGDKKQTPSAPFKDGGKDNSDGRDHTCAKQKTKKEKTYA